MNRKEYIEFMNQQYIQNKAFEIAVKRAKEECENNTRKLTELEQISIDAVLSAEYVACLMEASMT